ncbi:UNVERIFIED_CONTAM: hypothetical protein RMT77_006519 [Armadillidium vulgare]
MVSGSYLSSQNFCVHLTLFSDPCLAVQSDRNWLEIGVRRSGGPGVRGSGGFGDPQFSVNQQKEVRKVPENATLHAIAEKVGVFWSPTISTREKWEIFRNQGHQTRELFSLPRTSTPLTLLYKESFI